ncbi:hypothetical protein ACQ4PT_048399 [Festuca glaucescens]
MAEAILTAVSKIEIVVLSKAVSNVIEMLSKKVAGVSELPGKIKKIDDELKMLNNVIVDIGTTHLSNNAVKDWISNVRKLAYHVEDVIDMYLCEALKLTKEDFIHRYLLGGSRHIIVFSKIVDDLVEIEEEIKHVKEMQNNWSNTFVPIKNERENIYRTPPGACFPVLVGDEDLVGIEENRSKLTEWLSTDEKECTVITVSGVGGLGKTTLVKNVYEREKSNFPGGHAWIVVSQSYDVVDLLARLLRKLGQTFDVGAKPDVYELTEAIHRTLQDRKCLIVLDDVWDKEAYTQMCNAFQGLQGNRVMITTRKEDVAALAHKGRRMKLQPLGEDESFKLFCSRAFHNHNPYRQCPPKLKTVAAAIAERCHGLPLAIISCGGLLSTKQPTEHAWNQMYNHLQSELRENNHVQAILLSYYDLPERFGSANDEGELMLMDTEVRRFSTCGWKSEGSRPAAAGVEFPGLRTVMSIASSTTMISTILSRSNYLTVLELQDSAISHVPATIGNLLSLRYIGLRRTNIQSLPDSIEKLSNLETLDMKQTRIEKLPTGIVKVENLRHLFADRFADEKQTEFRYFVGVEAPKMISNFQELQTLETVCASKDLSQQLRKMSKLKTVWIDNLNASNCEELFDALSKMPQLSSVLLSASDETEALSFQALKPISTMLYRLIIRGNWAHGILKCPIFQGHTRYLKYLALSWCNLGTEDPLMLMAIHLPALLYFSLNRVSSAAILVIPAGCFAQLKTFVLKNMPNVKELVIQDKAIPCIDGIYIVSLREMNVAPHGIESLRSLKKLWLLSLHRDFRADWDLKQMHDKLKHVPELRA